MHLQIYRPIGNTGFRIPLMLKRGQSTLPSSRCNYDRRRNTYEYFLIKFLPKKNPLLKTPMHPFQNHQIKIHQHLILEFFHPISIRKISCKKGCYWQPFLYSPIRTIKDIIKFTCNNSLRIGSITTKYNDIFYCINANTITAMDSS